MSILVKGMKMPENCLSCPMQFGGWCYVAPAEIDERVAPTVDEAWEQGKPEWCPLVEVPEKHGRLVDVGDVKTAIKNLESYFDEHLIALLFSEIDKNVQTVIEAEGE